MRKKSHLYGLVFYAVSVLAAILAFPLKKGPPTMFKPAQKIPHRHELHGDVREDDYYWMRERDSGPVLEYLRQENKRTAEAMQGTEGLQKKLYQEMRSRIKEDDSSVPQFHDGYFYYTRFNKGQEYPLYCRREGSMEAREEILLDENEMAKGHEYFEVSALEISPDQRYLAFAVDYVGRRIYEIRVKDLITGQLLPDKIEQATPSLAWAKDNRTLFFVRQDLETLRADKLYRYELGTRRAPELVYDEKDTTFNIGVGLTKTANWIYLAIEKRDSSEWRLLDAADPKGQFRVFAPREANLEYSLADGGDRMYVLTNWKAKNFRVMEAPLTAKSKSEWVEVIPASEKIFREGLEVYARHMVLSERENGLAMLTVRDRKSGQARSLKFPDPTYELSLIPLEDYNTPYLRFAYESLVQPPSVYDEDLVSGQREKRKEREVPNYDRELYECNRIWATAKDGAKVPISVVYRKGLKLDGKNPALLYGYGSYGLNNDVNFRSSIVSLLDRGFVFALAQIRGGSEMGREWYEQGRLKHKLNTFTDFIASAETLIKDGYTSPEHLYIRGGSAGGLLMGAVMNMRPDLFKGVLAGVPFVDVMTTMLDESIPLTTGEYNEWGDPRKKEDYMYMRRYSPYDNVERKAYPNLLVTTGYHDSQVQYWEPAKWVAKLREYKTDDNLLLLYTEFDAGHSGASGRFEALKLLAKEYAFILMVEGIKD
jgi:oligopeptidase B